MTASWPSRLAVVTDCVYVSSVSRAEECRHYADLLTIPGEPWIESLRSLNEEVRVHMPMVHPA